MKTLSTISTILLLTLALSIPVHSQHLLTEDFDYPVGTILNTCSNWWANSGGGNNVLTITTPGLSYPGYPGSDIGNAVTMNVNGEDCGDTLGVKITSGNVYYSAMVNVTSAQTGDYFLLFGTGTASYYARLYVKKDPVSGFNFGISRGSVMPFAYTLTSYNFNQTYLIVVKYAFTPGSLNDVVNLFINPIPGGSEPVPTLTATDLTSFDATTIDKFFLRQGSSGSSPKVIVDGIRVSTTWDDLPLPVELSSFTSKLSGRDVNLNWSSQTEKNSDKFLIERKSTQDNWESIGSVKAAVLSNSPKQYSYVDKNIQSGKYQYRLKMIDNDGSFAYSKIIEADVSKPMNYELCQNYPNPFNPSTKINYNIPVDSKVTLEVFNLNGERVTQLVNEEQSAGYYSIDFNSTSINRNLSSGVYFYRIIVSDKVTGTNFSSIKKMVLLK
ncbi:MAG: T9SS type A sorting domain-containing protein [Ignavibacteriaceae bacterium]|nr:T9SS type A sorting domain-containing protein [Ignavibacteriaceae bacterium]